MREMLECGFQWAKSPEGGSYWVGVSRKLDVEKDFKEGKYKARRVYQMCVERGKHDTAKKILAKYNFTLMDRLRDLSVLTDWRNLSGVSNQQTQ